VSKTVLAASCLLVLAGLAAADDPAPVRIGVLAIRGPEQCLKRWSPTAKYLTGQIPGYRFMIVPLDHDEVGPAVGRGEIAFLLANPALYVEMERLYGATRIATLRGLYHDVPLTVYAAAIICRSNRADIQHIADVEDKTLMAVEQWSFGGWQMAWRELAERGIDPARDLARLEFGDTHDAVVYAVRDGKVDVGVVRADTLARMASEEKIRLSDYRVLDPRPVEKDVFPFLHSTRVYPEWPLAKTRGTSDELAKKVAVALLDMPPESPAAKASGTAGWAIPQNYQAVHECLKELRIGPYKDYGKMTFAAALRRYWPWWVGLLALLVVAAATAAYVARLNRGLALAVSRYRGELAERTRAEAALQRSEQLRAASEKLAAIGRLAAGIAHEINNPLTGVLTFSHLLREKENLDDQDRQDLDLIIHETTRASGIVRDLLDFARERPSEKRTVQLNEIVRRTVRLLGNQKAFQKITIVENLDDGLPGVEADENQIQQVLVNLLLNACAAMSDGGTLMLSSTLHDGHVCVAVADTGTGIRREHLHRIFEPFFSTKSVGQGTGLGLSVSYGIVQQHGGRLEVESQEGMGSTFTVVLPAARGKQGAGGEGRGVME